MLDRAFGKLCMPGPIAPSPINELNERSREIFRLIVDGYVATGEPVG